MLALGIFFLLLACAQFAWSMYIGKHHEVRFVDGPKYKHSPGSHFGIALGTGLLLTGVGIYALRKGKE